MFEEYALWSGKDYSGKDVVIISKGVRYGHSRDFDLLGHDGFGWKWYNDQGENERRTMTNSLVDFPLNFNAHVKKKFTAPKQALHDKIQTVILARMLKADPKTITADERKMIQDIMNVVS